MLATAPAWSAAPPAKLRLVNPVSLGPEKSAADSPAAIACSNKGLQLVGDNRVCHYECNGAPKVIIVPVTQLCPSPKALETLKDGTLPPRP
jgi:hypothetical protein